MSGPTIANSQYVRLEVVFAGGTISVAVIDASVDIYGFST